MSKHTVEIPPPPPMPPMWAVTYQQYILLRGYEGEWCPQKEQTFTDLPTALAFAAGRKSHPRCSNVRVIPLGAFDALLAACKALLDAAALDAIRLAEGETERGA